MFALFIVLENPNLALRFFCSEVLNKYVGESEANIRSVEQRVFINCFTDLLKKKGLRRVYVDGICSVAKEASCFK